MSLPVVRAETPCRQCPKWQLFPSNFGLHPANELAVEIYACCRHEQRVGTFAGAPLLRTLTPEGVCKVLDEFERAGRLPTWLRRHNAFAKVMIIDEVATEVLGAREERMRAAREAQSKADADRGQRR